MRDLYEILGVPKTADQDTIKKAFKKLARENHPDKNPTKEAEARFKEANAANSVLGDEEKRKLYDEFGEVSLRPGFNAEQARAYGRMGGGGGQGFPGFGGQGFSEGFSFEDLFGDIYGGGGRGGRGRRGPPAGTSWRRHALGDRRRAAHRLTRRGDQPEGVTPDERAG
jgi:DnaJ-class molecular chaperone